MKFASAEGGESHARAGGIGIDVWQAFRRCVTGPK